MYKIFIPQDKGRRKTNIRGFWKSPQGKIYYDYLTIQEYKDDNLSGLYKHLEQLRKFYNQEAIFYTDDKKAYIFNGVNDITELSKNERIVIDKNKKILRWQVIQYINAFGGVTVINRPESYIIESWRP